MRHEFKITWVHNGIIHTRTNFHPCTSIKEVLRAFQKSVIIISVEDMTLAKEYAHLQAAATD